MITIGMALEAAKSTGYCENQNKMKRIYRDKRLNRFDIDQLEIESKHLKSKYFKIVAGIAIVILIVLIAEG